MQSTTTLADPTKMGDLDILPVEIVGKVIENLTVGDVINMMSLNKYSHATLKNYRCTVIPTLFNIVKRPQKPDSLEDWKKCGSLKNWVISEPDDYKGKNIFKLLHKVAEEIKPWNFGEMLNATTAGENQRCTQCRTQVRWTDIKTGKPRCEKCAVWGWCPLLDSHHGIVWDVADGKVCTFVNLAAARECRQKKEQGQKHSETPLLK
ncbi:hypothetical protein SLS62_006999 [Diatrype stigma]|uniref:F-box domain-containing protein n=1 Tax=Diatrype stigma TaxID=117547 RepID=A0AAN9ULV0_9PEZI